jgi:hypothetical protein
MHVPRCTSRAGVSLVMCREAGVFMLQLTSRQTVVLAIAAIASPMMPAHAQSPAKTHQWPLTMQDVRPTLLAQAVTPPAALPAGTPAPGQATTQPPLAAAAPVPAEMGWTETEIATARARCNAILARYDAVATPMEPIREGECGTPYPVQLTSINKVALSQAAIVNCEMVAALGDWLKIDVQPAAKKLLGQQVVGIEVLSSYSCRNAYGRKRSRLSEHGRANAIDIKGFKLARQDAVDLRADWGMTERDIKARIAAAEAAARAHAAARAKAEAEAQAQAVARAQQQKQRGLSTPGPTVAERNDGQNSLGLVPSADGLTGLRGLVGTPTIRGLGADEAEGRSSSGLTLGQPFRLGGPKGKTEAAPTAPAPSETAKTAPSVATDTNGQTARQKFLRVLYTSGCHRFATALGPEANEAHRNHFHFDLADRGGRGSFCQ